MKFKTSPTRAERQQLIIVGVVLFIAILLLVAKLNHIYPWNKSGIQPLTKQQLQNTNVVKD